MPNEQICRKNIKNNIKLKAGVYILFTLCCMFFVAKMKKN